MAIKLPSQTLQIKEGSGSKEDTERKKDPQGQGGNLKRVEPM